ncbi:MAG: SIR2 family protein [Thermoanaerobaculia bacterium]|nr:SIR2 family protein [Thermoanaerobaculia bacterium]
MPIDLGQKPVADLGHLLAEAPRNVVFVVGAGLSRPAGVPLWAEFQSSLADEVRAYLEKRSDAEAANFSEQFEAHTDPWFRGNLLESAYPSNLYIAAVRRLLTPTSETAGYGCLAALKASGIISLNLDNLAAGALDIRQERRATAVEPSKFQKFLLLNQPYLFQPHGTLQDSSSWVLTARARQKLLQENHEYRRFMAALFQSRRLVLLGFRPRDFAFESLLLDDFRGEAATGVCHYWITRSLSIPDKAWATQYNLTPIEYSAASDAHDEILELLRHLATYSPRADPPHFSYRGPAISPDDLPPDRDLRLEGVEDIRRKLNAAARGLLDGLKTESHETKLGALSDFLASYKASAHMAWLVTPDGEYDRLFGSRVAARIGDGTFGEIWRVEDPVDGTTKIVKILRHELASSPEFVEAFRRGVDAARILTDRGVNGMVRFLDAYEIPPCIFMEFIDGPTLAEVVGKGKVKSLARGLAIVERVARIVGAAHNLRENVLHRDLKPSNVMIEDFYSDPGGGVVKVLDFDLSWYEGAAGRTLLGGARYQGYAAPEQLQSRPVGVSTRHKAVDVFGLGMLLYFVATKRDPEPNSQKAPDFESATREHIAAQWNTPFGSVAWYLAGLIAQATADRQEDRIGLPAFISGVELVRKALEDGALPVPSDLVIVELLQRIGTGVWHPEPLREGVGKLHSGAGEIVIQFEDEGTTPVLGLRIVYNAAGEMNWKSVKKYLEQRREQATAILKRAGFRIVEAHAGGASLVISGRRSRPQINAGDLATISRGVVEAAQRATFG